MVFLLGLLALLIRLTYLFETADIPFLKQPVGDAARYLEWAQGIAAGDWLGKEPFYQAPLYPYLLGALFVVTGPSVWGVRLLQVIIGSLSVCLLAVGTSRLFGRKTGIVAGAILCFYPPIIFFDGLIQKASLDGFLVSLLFFLLAAEVRRFKVPSVKPWRFLTVGVVCGLLCLTRENALVWVPLLAGWIFFRKPRFRYSYRLAALSSYLLGISLVLCPVALRNHCVGGEWSLSTFQAGPNFYIGNHVGASGRYEPLVRGHETPEFERADATRLAEQAMGYSLTAKQVSQYWSGRAIAFIQAYPVDWIRLMAHKFIMTWNRYEVSDVESMAVYEEYSLLFRWLRPLLHFGVICPLAAMGIGLTWAARSRLWIYWAMILMLACSVALFFVLARYRIALVPLLIPFASVALARLYRWYKAGRIESLKTGFVVAALAAIATNVPVQNERRLNATSYTNFGVAVGENGDLKRAEHYFLRALHDFPQSVEAHFNFGYLLLLQERFDEAGKHFETALRYQPDLIHADYLLAQCLEKTGDRSGAIQHYRRAIELDPTQIEALEKLEKLIGP